MSKGQRNHSRQPVAQSRGREAAAQGNKGGFIKPRNVQGSAAGDKKPFVREGDARAPFKRDERQPGSGQGGRHFGDKKPFAREGDARAPFKRDERQPGSGQGGRHFGDKKPFVREGDARAPFKRDERQPGSGQGGRHFGDKKPFARQGDERQTFNHRDERRAAADKGGRSFGDNKPFNRQGDKPEAGYGEPRRDAGERTFAPRNGAPLKIQRAKKLSLRAPSSKIADKSQRLRETRVDLDKIEPVRLQKVLAASGAGSRREVEEMIEAGLITVNGKVASLGDRVGPQDRVVVKGHPVKLKWADRLPRIIMYHKQEGEIVSRADPEGRVTVFDRLPQAKSSRWVAIGRLDINTSGLLLVTTSGELANRMMHPSFEMEREYSVRVLGELTPEIMKEMVAGVELEDGHAQFVRVYQSGGVDEDKANKWINVVIKEGRNREVRRMFEHFGLTVSRLIRIRFGNIGLPGRLKRGQFYELNEAEVAAVMKWAGLTSTGQARR